MHCTNHPQTPGIGVCVRCRSVVCEACTTRLQGRNFCRRCLSSRAEPEGAEVPHDSTAFARGAWLVIAACFGLVLGVGAVSLGFLLYVAG